MVSELRESEISKFIYIFLVKNFNSNYVPFDTMRYCLCFPDMYILYVHFVKVYVV
jgi:hypothetical protein